MENERPKEWLETPVRVPDELIKLIKQFTWTDHEVTAKQWREALKHEGSTCVWHHACSRGFVPVAEFALNEDRKHWPSDAGFYSAIRNGKLNIVEWTHARLQADWKPRESRSFMNTCLLEAVKHGQKNIRNWSIAHGADDFHCPMVYLARRGDTDGTKWLLDNAAELIDMRRIHFCFREAAYSGKVEYMKWLMQRHGEVVEISNDALIAAVSRAELGTTKWLVEEGGATMDPCECFIEACCYNHVPTIRYLRERCNDINDIDIEAAMGSASWGGCLDACKWLKGQGAKDWDEAIARCHRGAERLPVWRTTRPHAETMEWLLRQRNG